MMQTLFCQLIEQGLPSTAWFFNKLLFNQQHNKLNVFESDGLLSFAALSGVDFSEYLCQRTEALQCAARLKEWKHQWFLLRFSPRHDPVGKHITQQEAVDTAQSLVAFQLDRHPSILSKLFNELQLEFCDGKRRHQGRGIPEAGPRCKRLFSSSSSSLIFAESSILLSSFKSGIESILAKDLNGRTQWQIFIASLWGRIP